MEPDRTLAQIVKIVSLTPIKDADRIELARVLGWDVVVKKDEFHVDDLAIYFSISSILDKNHPNTSFLEGKPIKTKKIRGVVSQGLLAPLSWLVDFKIESIKEGDDLTTQFNVKKWVPLDEEDIYKQNNETRAPFPIIVPKTDEDRIQNSSKKLIELKDKNIIITQKYDGTSTTFIWYNDQFMICSRNNYLFKPDKTTTHYFEIARKYDLESVMKSLNRNLAIQGETIGPKIGWNRHKVTELDFFVFNIYDIDRQYYMSWTEIIEITKVFKLKTVKVIYHGLMQEEWLVTDNLLKMADEQKYDTGMMCEGLVIKSDYGFGFPRTSFKVISNKYLIKYNL